MKSRLTGIGIFLGLILLAIPIGVWLSKGAPGLVRDKARIQVSLHAAMWNWGVRDLRVVRIGEWTGIDATFIPVSGPGGRVKLDAAILRGMCGTLLMHLASHPDNPVGPIYRKRVYRVQIDVIGGRNLDQRLPQPFRVAVRDGACDSPNGKTWYFPPYPPPLDRWKIFQVAKSVGEDKGRKVVISFAWNGKGDVPPLDDFPYEFACNAVIADPPPRSVNDLEGDFMHISVKAWRLSIDLPIFRYGHWQRRDFLRKGGSCILQGKEEKA